MPFVSTNKSIDDFKKNIHQDYVYVPLTIHDEEDVVVDKYLKEGILYKLTKISENKKVFDKFGFKFINFYFDVEHDKFDSFTSSSSFNPMEVEVKRIEEVICDELGVVKTSETSDAQPVIEENYTTTNDKEKPKVKQNKVISHLKDCVLLTLPDDYDLEGSFMNVIDELTVDDNGKVLIILYKNEIYEYENKISDDSMEYLNSLIKY